MCAATLAYPLTKIFNLSFNLGQIPSDWKYANIVPVHKKGDKNNIENYRPISLTSLRGCSTVTVLEHMLIKCIFGVIVREYPSLAVSAALSVFYSNFS